MKLKKNKFELFFIRYNKYILFFLFNIIIFYIYYFFKKNIDYFR